MLSSNGTLTIVEGPLAGREYSLAQEAVNIGRSDRSDIVIDAPVVSRRHARVVWRDVQYYIEDLGSSNGTFLNGQQVQQARPLAPGDEVALGHSVRLHFAAPEAAAEGPVLEDPVMEGTLMEGTIIEEAGYDLPREAPPQEPEPVATPPPRLLVQVVGQAAEAHDLQKEVVTIGRAEDNDVFIPSRIVSRHPRRLEYAHRRERPGQHDAHN